MKLSIVHSLDPALMALLEQISQKETLIMATLEETVTEMEKQTTLVSGLQVFIQHLEDQVAALPGLTAAQQTQIDTIFNTASANDARIANAMVVNTPTAGGAS